MLKTICTGTAIAGLTLASSLPAQLPRTQADFIAQRDRKLAKPVFQKADWFFDYDKARQEARRQGKLLFTYFSRSYAH